MHKNNYKEKKHGKYPSLYDAFNLGDRVTRIYKDQAGKQKEYKGMIMAIDEETIEVYWDTLNGRYRPNDMDIAFTTCHMEEIFKGNGYFSPIKKY